MQTVTEHEKLNELQERRQIDLKQAETRLNFEMNADRQSRKESEVKTGKLVDESLYNLRLELTREKKARDECSDRYENTFMLQISQIQNSIMDESK